jgi:hypothetical protein
MANIKNKRLAGKGVKPSRQATLKLTFGLMKKYIKEIPKAQKIMLLSVTAFNIAALILMGIFLTSMEQHICIVALLISNLITGIVYKLIKKDKGVLKKIVVLFCVVLFLVSFTFSIINQLNLQASLQLKQDINRIKNSSELIISTEQADVYLNLDEMALYTISNISKQKYINKSYVSQYENSELYYLYNVGISLNYSSQNVSEVFLYMPTPYTITGYDYLLEFDYRNQRYVSKFFLPGYVDLPLSNSTLLFNIKYGSDKNYDVNRFDEYFVFRSETSSFSTPFQNVPYNENEYFYVRYNRYIRQMAANSDEDVEQIKDTDVRYINSKVLLSPVIKQVNFFWIGYEESETFYATTPVIEIVYNDGTSDIAVIKDISAKEIDSIVGY